MLQVTNERTFLPLRACCSLLLSWLVLVLLLLFIVVVLFVIGVVAVFWPVICLAQFVQRVNKRISFIIQYNKLYSNRATI